MTKDKLTVESVKKDLLKVAGNAWERKSDRREGYIILPLLLAIGLGIGFRNVWMPMPFILLALYHIIRLIPELREVGEIKKKIREAVDRGDFSVSVDRLSHVSGETVHEPHMNGIYTHSARDINVFYFLSGTSWRVPYVGYHYDWSREMKMSRRGLLNTSVKDNDFYVITLKGHQDISYVYNTKMFELGEGLEIKD